MAAMTYAVLSYEVEHTWVVFFMSGRFTALQYDRYAARARANLTRRINATILASSITTPERPMMAALAAVLPNGIVPADVWLELVDRWKASLDLHTLLEEASERDVAYCHGLGY
jgi:hypothetical protein